MPTISPLRRIERDLAALQPERSQVNLALEFIAPDGRSLYSAGGIWDTRKFKYIGPATTTRKVRLVTSQLKAADQLAKWFAAYDRGDEKRLSLSICVDRRRGGKTFFCVSSIVCFADRYPLTHLGATITAIVVPTFPQQREIHHTIRSIIPAEWFRDGRIRYHKSENYYEFCTGAQIWIKSADRSETLKVGKFAAVAINEAQQVDYEALINVLGGAIDEGGITWLAMNPPNSIKGIWAENLYDAVNAVDDHGKPLLEFAEMVKFPSALNEAINKHALTKFERVASIIDPDQAKRDALGLWISIRDRAYPKYNRSNHLRPEPRTIDGWRDVTADVNGLTYMHPIGQARHFGAGMDYQRRPWCAFVELKVYAAPEGVWVPRGTHVYVVRMEITNDVQGGDYWTEQLLCQKIEANLESRGLTPDHHLLVCDATGKNQGASGEQRGRMSDPATWSWAICEQYGWEPHGPQEQTKWVSLGKGRGKEQKFTATNPPVSVRLDVINTLLDQDRLIITPDCPATAESFRICEVRKETRKPWGRGAHLTDAVGYLCYVWETALIEAHVVQRRVQ